MKVSSKTISSPGRREKYPPPLMRFLRSNVGSRSRGRSRSSPMFVCKRNNVAAAIETQEPSSPKVTCIGQVRVRRSSKNTGSKSRRASSRSKAPEMQRRWRCWRVFRRALLSNTRRLKPKSFRPVWRKWVLFFRFGYCKKSDIGADSSSKFDSNRRSQYEYKEDEDGEDYNGNLAETEHSNEVLKPSEPPKNALILTRCRSAPYRSSSLASRFWGSPLSETGNGRGEEAERESEVDRRLERPILENKSNGRDSSAELRNGSECEETLGVCNKYEDQINGRSRDTDNYQELRLTEGGSSGPLFLKRCKSEPARTGERLDPVANFWRQTKGLGYGEPCSLLSYSCD